VAAEENGLELDYEQARKIIYGMTYSEWKKKYWKSFKVFFRKRRSDYPESVNESITQRFLCNLILQDSVPVFLCQQSDGRQISNQTVD